MTSASHLVLNDWHVSFDRFDGKTVFHTPQMSNQPQLQERDRMFLHREEWEKSLANETKSYFLKKVRSTNSMMCCSPTAVLFERWSMSLVGDKMLDPVSDEQCKSMMLPDIIWEPLSTETSTTPNVSAMNNSICKA